jgi:hypothetical protein
LLNPVKALGFHTAPLGRESLSRMFSQGFTLGYFRFIPPGYSVSNAAKFPHLELLTADRVC